jgi:hypothetical protein
MALDRKALLAHIKEKADHPQLLVYAVLTGLAMKIERGDFDMREEVDDGENTDAQARPENVREGRDVAH